MPTSRRELFRYGASLGTLALLALREDALQHVQAAVSRLGDATPEQAARDESFWFQVQRAFEIDRSLINLNNGGVSPAPQVVLEAARRHMEYANNAPARHLWSKLDPQVETSRAHLARVFGCSPEEMAIVRNASEALEICIYGIDLKPGDEVLTTDQDYGRMINTFKQRVVREGIVLHTPPIPTPAESPLDILEVFRKHITPRTRVLHCAHMINITGQIVPVREIVRLGREHDIPVIVDGAHAFGHLVFNRDDLECDYYGTSLHKWMTCPIGTGFLYVRKERIESLWPLMAAPEPKSDNIRKFEEIGTHPNCGYLAISDAAMFFEGIGPHRKQERMRYLRDRWAQRLLQDKRCRLHARTDAANSCGVATLAIEGIDPTRLAEHLFAKHRIFVTVIDHPSVKGIRVTPNVYTTLSEIDTFSAAVEEVLANGLPA